MGGNVYDVENNSTFLEKIEKHEKNLDNHCFDLHPFDN